MSIAWTRAGAQTIGDFNGDGKGDIVWRQSTTGQLGIWLMDGFTPIDNTPISGENPNWQVAGIGDFDGDGRADILWHQPTTGANSIWLMNGLHMTDGRAIASIALTWSVVGVGDFDGDGKADILWRDRSTGVVGLWLMDGFAVKASPAISAPFPAWEIGGVADFNGDGHADILWRQATTGQVGIWLMNGVAAIASAPISGENPTWRVDGVGDFDGDGRADILWHQPATGANSIWRMNGLQVLDGQAIAYPGIDWSIVSTGDTNGDGRADILFRQASTGVNLLWQMNAFTLAGASVISASYPAWDIVGTGVQHGTLQFEVLHGFSLQPPPGAPSVALMQAANGYFYGTTDTVGVGQQGTVFRMDAAGTVTVLHTFTGAPDGALPQAALIQATDGNLYGTTSLGGTFNQGTIFRMTLDGTVTLLHSFTGVTNEGTYPNGALVQATDGNFYGMTSENGTVRTIIFRLSPDGTFAVLHVFDPHATTSTFPGVALIQASDGNLYGTAGILGGVGAVFRTTLNGDVTVLHQFTGQPDGAAPHAGLIEATDGNFYGTTESGGEFGIGAIFKVTRTGDLTIVHSFTGAHVQVFEIPDADGGNPWGGLVQAADGMIFGTTGNNGTIDSGTVFQMTPGGTFVTIHRFSGIDGTWPTSALIQGADGNLYGVSQYGSSTKTGTAYRIRH
jgi:uncharacterized repeat protein (TIGR03803 family)